MNRNARYIVANPLEGHEGQERVFSGEHFEIYSPPIRSRYSEVVWRRLEPVQLPEEIRRRFNNSVMAVTGWEVDVVRKTPTGDQSVPCYESYNHHYTATIRGKHASVSKQPGPDMGHGPMLMFHAGGGLEEVPQVQYFNEHNGNEHRQTYHGLPRGYVQLVESPETFIFNPMQINMRNPDGSGRRGGPLPRSSAAPPGAPYSGLLECPCTTRVKKVLKGHTTTGSGQCGAAAGSPWALHSAAEPRSLPVSSADECFAAAASLFSGATLQANVTVEDGSLPPGCVAAASKSGTRYQAIFNTVETSKAPCGSTSGRVARAVGSRRSLVALDLDLDEAADEVRITAQGPDGQWFGVGFGAFKMADQPYTIVVDGWGNVSERRLADHAEGRLLEASVQVVSNVVSGGRRTVVLTRALRGHSPSHFTFRPGQTTVPFINALGGGPSFGQHVARSASSVSLLELGGTTCVCRQPGGTIDGIDFDPDCPAWPLSDLARNQNPTCDVSTYVGGMACCRDGMFLLDADQDVPEHVDEVYFKWRFYFSEYDPKVQTPTMHLEWALNGCDSGGPAGIRTACNHIEYDVPRAPAGTPPAEAVHTVTSHFQLRDMMSPCDVRGDAYCADPSKVTSAGVRLIMAGGHCHAPACLSLELWDADRGEPLCLTTPRGGRGDAVMDEEGYLWLPPCQWGSAEEGLRPPPVLHLHSNLTSVKRSNSTYYHYGVMAIWQMRGAYAAPPPARYV